MQWVAGNVERVREQMAAACRRAGRSPQHVTLVAVSKGHPAELVRAAWAAGLREFGESRLQEAQPKCLALRDLAITWHLVGRLQTNKINKALASMQVLHAVDSSHLIEALAARAQGQPPEVFLQVNISGEATKSGAAPEEAEALARQLRATPSLRWRGLMTMAPAVENPAAARPVFRGLRQLRDTLQARLGVSRLQLSMGMSHDVAVAIEEGADVVRIGSAIFQEDYWHDR